MNNEFNDSVNYLEELELASKKSLVKYIYILKKYEENNINYKQFKKEILHTLNNNYWLTDEIHYIMEKLFVAIKKNIDEQELKLISKNVLFNLKNLN